MLGSDYLGYVYSLDMTDQQERLRIEGWVVGFTDGEGCFSISMFRNKTSKFGWQVFPEFVITQGKKSLPALKMFQTFFKCGKVFVNKRYDNHHEHLYRYCVRSISDLRTFIIPFFKKHPLRTAKQNDFVLFTEIVEMLHRKEHLTERGLQTIARNIQRMNRKKPSRFLESSETIRHAPARDAG
jgi:hypothetical protein